MSHQASVQDSVQGSYYDGDRVGYVNIVDLQSVSLKTTCTVCWYYRRTVGTLQVVYYSLKPLNYSFEVIANNQYELRSDSQNLTIPSAISAYFKCILHNESKADRWTLNGMVIKDVVDSTGSLLIKDTNETFGRSTIGNVLVCSNDALNTSLSVVIFLNATPASEDLTNVPVPLPTTLSLSNASYELRQDVSKRTSPIDSFETPEKEVYCSEFVGAVFAAILCCIILVIMMSYIYIRHNVAMQGDSKLLEDANGIRNHYLLPMMGTSNESLSVNIDIQYKPQDRI
ncbi:hypothetical protein EMCRGX_G018060 [Ephydatia muelleri]